MFPEVGKVDVNVKFPIFMEWIIDENSIYNGNSFSTTKDYDFPGFAGFKYWLSHGGIEEEEETFDFALSISNEICDCFDIEVDLTFTINGKEPKKIAQKLRATEVGRIILWTDLFEVLINHLDKNRQITLQLSGTFTFVRFDNEFQMHFNNDLLWKLLFKIEDKVRHV
uniref:Uncharacterized protein n=1 Tax=Panagrolaimus sp. ES5 TaxID=591445 RepID=A0AC34G7U6_9BILA